MTDFMVSVDFTDDNNFDIFYYYLVLSGVTW